MPNPLHSEITASIVDAALQLHREIGPGMLESAYEVLLADELRNRGHSVVRQVALTLYSLWLYMRRYGVQVLKAA